MHRHYAQQNASPDGDVTTPNAAALSIKCRQYANGALYLEDGEYAEVHNAKLDALGDIIEEASGQPILLFYQFRSDLERIQQRFKTADHIDDIDLEDWDNGCVPLLLAHPMSAGHGLNLQAGGHIAVWFGLDWNLELMQQANKRLHRSGQEHTVVIHYLLTECTLDAGILTRLAAKAEEQDVVMSS